MNQTLAKKEQPESRRKKWLRSYIYIEDELNEEIAECIKARKKLLDSHRNPHTPRYFTSPWF